jgi:peptidoglycan hydrolase CwlO-like protein
MKGIKLSVMLALTISCAVIQAQKPIAVTEKSVSFKDAKYPGLVVNIPECNSETTTKNWIRELQSGTKSKVVTENTDMTITGAIIKEISPNPMTIYSKFMTQDSMLFLMVTFELAGNTFIEQSNGEKELTQAKAFLKQFAKDQYVEKVELDLKTEKKNLKELENGLESLQKEKMHTQKSIQSNKTDISEAKSNITILNGELSKLTEEITTQNNQMIGMQPGAVKDEKADYLKSIEKRRKKVLNETESAENKISKRNSEIEEFEDNIVKNEADQEAMKGKITQQELVVKKYEEKLAKVKSF